MNSLNFFINTRLILFLAYSRFGEITIPFENLKSEIKRDTILYIFLSFFEYFFSKTISHDDTYTHIYTRDSIQRRLFSVSSPRKSNFFAGSFLLVLLLRRSYRLESERKNPATDPVAPLISGDKEAGRKIGRGGRGAWRGIHGRDGRE